MKKLLMALPVVVLALPITPAVWFYWVYVRGVQA